MTDMLGAVLAGGRSTRFGSDKALAMVDGRTLLDHALATLAGVTPHVAVCGRDWPGTLSLPDRPAAGMGPLSGLNAALHHARALGLPWVLTLACDTPFVPAAALAALLPIARTPLAGACLAAHPVVGLWLSAHADTLDHRLLHDGDRSIRAFARAIGAALVETDVAIPNFNHAADLARWTARRDP